MSAFVSNFLSTLLVVPVSYRGSNIVKLAAVYNTSSCSSMPEITIMIFQQLHL